MNISRRVGQTRPGFTIVELLIVVVVIAILAAITIVAYNGVSNKAKDSAVASAASQAMKKIKTAAITSGDTVPTDLAAIGLNDGNGVQYQYTTNTSTSPAGFCLTAIQGGRAAYTASNFTYSGGTIEQASAVSGTCPGHTTTGSTIIKNLVPNPNFEVSTAGWSSGGSATAARSATWASSGSYSMAVTNTTTANTGDLRPTSFSTTTFAFGMEAGKTYTVTARLYQPVAYTGSNNRAPGVLFWYSTDGAYYTEAFGPKATATTGVQTVSHTFTIPANATGAFFGFGAASTTANQTFYYDSIMLVEGSTARNFADGSTGGWVWQGTANFSASYGPVV